MRRQKDKLGMDKFTPEGEKKYREEQMMRIAIIMAMFFGGVVGFVIGAMFK